MTEEQNKDVVACFNKLKQAFEQQKDITAFRIYPSYTPTLKDYNQLVNNHITPYVSAKKAINYLATELKQKAKRSEYYINQFYSFSEEVTGNKNVQQNIQYFFHQQEEVTKSTNWINGLQNISTSIDFSKPLNQIVKILVDRVRLYENFLKAFGNENGEISRQYFQFYKEYVSKHRTFHLIQKLQVLQSFRDNFAQRKQKKIDYIEKGELEKITKAFQTKYEMQGMDIVQKLRKMASQLRDKLQFQSDISTQFKKVKTFVNYYNSMPNDQQLNSKNKNNKITQFFDLIKIIRQKMKKYYTINKVANYNQAYDPLDGVTYQNLVAVIDQLWKKMTNGSYSQSVIENFSKRVQKIKKAVQNSGPAIQSQRYSYNITDPHSLYMNRLVGDNSKQLDELRKKNKFYESLKDALVSLFSTFKRQSKEKFIAQNSQMEMSPYISYIVSIANYIQKSYQNQSNKHSIKRQGQHYKSFYPTNNFDFNNRSNYESSELGTKADKEEKKSIQIKQHSNQWLKNNEQLIGEKKSMKEKNTVSYVNQIDSQELKNTKSQLKIIQDRYKIQETLLSKEKRKIMKIEEKNRDHQRKISIQKEEIDKLKEKLASKEKQLSQKIDDHNELISNCTKIVQLQQKVNNLTSSSKQLNIVLNQKEYTIAQQEKSIKKFKEDLEILERKQQERRSQQKKKSQKKNAVIQNAQRQQLEEKDKIILEKEIQLNKLREDIKSYQKQLVNLKARMKNNDEILTKQQQQLEKVDFERQKELQSKQKQIRELQTKLNQLKSEVQLIQQKMDKQSQRKNEKISQLKQYQESVLKKDKEIKQKQEQIVRLEQQISKGQIIINQLSQHIQKLQDQNKNLNDKLSKMSSRFTASTIGSDTNVIPYSRILFNQEIFGQDHKSKEILISHIEKYAKGATIKRTPLIYKYDPRNKNNFHLYIDDIKNLTLVVKTKHAIIAGFYPGEHKEKELMNKGGLLVSVTNDQSYTLFEKKPGMANSANIRGMTYDQFFAIYGNAQIRIKTGLKTVFSNFGVNNAFYNSRGHKIDVFLNEGDKRQVEFEYMEFYQVIFDEEPIEYLKEIV